RRPPRTPVVPGDSQRKYSQAIPIGDIINALRIRRNKTLAVQCSAVQCREESSKSEIQNVAFPNRFGFRIWSFLRISCFEFRIFSLHCKRFISSNPENISLGRQLEQFVSICVASRQEQGECAATGGGELVTMGSFDSINQAVVAE